MQHILHARFRLSRFGTVRGFLLAGLVCLSANYCKGAADSEKPAESLVVKNSHVSLRTDPLSTAAELGFLESGNRVRVIRKSTEKVKVGSFNDYWYFVKSESGLTGWVYGANLSSDQSQASTTDQSLPENLEEKIVGKWWEYSATGAVGYFKLYFWSDGSYKHGYGASPMQEGEYKIRRQERVIELDKGSFVGEKIQITMQNGELRLTGDYKGKTIQFRKGDENPDSAEINDSDTSITPKKKKQTSP